MALQSSGPLLAFFAIVLAASGCKGGTRLVKLGPIASAIHGVEPPEDTCFVLEPYLDKREDRDEIGSARNGFGIKLASAVTNDSVADWMSDQLAADLRHAGAAVNIGCQPSDGIARIRPSVKEAYVREFWNLSGTIEVTITLATQTSTRTRNFIGEYSQTSHFASTAEFTETLHKTLEALHDELVPWLFDPSRDGVR